MDQSDLLRRLSEELERLGISYFVTGSMATINYGEPRFTNDIDVVMHLNPGDADALCSVFFAPEYYCSKDAVIHAIQQKFQFNVLHPKSGLKVDVIVAADDDFNRSRFRRRVRRAGGADFDVWFASAEDVIIKKLEYFKDGKSEKHVRDIIGVLNVRGAQIDREYIATWAERLQLSEIWIGILERLSKP